MTQHVNTFIENVVIKGLIAVVRKQELRDCRFGIFNDKIAGGGFRWICLDIVGEPGQQQLWAHTNDFDGMVYGWSACEFSLTTTDLDEAFDKITAFLVEKAANCERIEVKYTGTSSEGRPLPTLVGDSDTGELKEPLDIQGF